jgi:SAM-dependent methyltransferase
MKAEQFEVNAQIEERHWWFVARRRILRAIVERVVPPSRQSLIVDIGCGTGANIAALAEQYECIGIDPSAEAIAHAQKRFPGVRFLCGEGPEVLKTLGRAPELILLSDVLEHLSDDFLFFSQLATAMPVGAHLLLTVPAKPALWSPHDVSFGHYRRYEPERLARVWQGLPMSSRLFSYFNSQLYPIVRTARLLTRLRGHSVGSAGTDFRLPRAWLNRWLTAVFAGETRVLLDVLDGGRKRGYRAGVSLIALLRREPGDITPRSAEEFASHAGVVPA